MLGKVAEKPVEEEAYPPETAGPLLFSRPSHNRPEHGFLRTASESVIFADFWPRTMHALNASRGVMRLLVRLRRSGEVPWQPPGDCSEE